MIILSSGLLVLLEVISVRAINSISQSTGSNQVDINFIKCGIAMASSGNINRGIQLIIDVINYKMLKGKYLVDMLSAHPMRSNN